MTVHTITISPAIDRTFVVDDLQVGELRRATSVLVEPAGKGLNVSRALAAAYLETRAVALVGGAEGDQFLRLLAGERVRCRTVRSDRPTRTNVTILSPGTTTKVNSPPSPVSADEMRGIIGAAAEDIAAGDWIVVGGAIPPGGDDLIPAVAAIARDRRARLCVDSSGSALRVAIELGASLIAPNLDELAEIDERARAARDRPLRDRARYAARAARRIADRTRGQVLVSLGPLGAVWSDGRTAWHGVTGEIRPVNTAGAGDALLAGFLAAPRAPIATRVATAVAWGAAACCLPGTSGDLPGEAHSVQAGVTPV